MKNIETNQKLEIRGKTRGETNDCIGDEISTVAAIYNPRNENENPEERFWGAQPTARLMELRDGPSGRICDLDERTALFGEAIIQFAKKIPQSPVNKRLIEQLVGAGTSVGANYCEANDGVSRKDFKNKICICRKEARETKFFLRMIASSEPALKAEARKLWQEAKELNLIFSAIWRK